ncbi:hypothetical protein [Candidatus Uabimicrobium amorphum]|uniref:Uncharacterized protein n=1 Tax=Uabimicrobium amorphum TaxID=2596890 RepID=A0A5S9IP62_UABAM|nr:hypothetical protein [Candidatus Uabimicrobium amorphum]BBM85131.1 hypothetical protein UABAM_03494 [Candidatus Uabimicrobium amorphum]
MKIFIIKIFVIITVAMLKPPFEFVENYQFGVTTYSNTKITIFALWFVGFLLSVLWLSRNSDELTICALLALCRPRFDTSFYFVSWAKANSFMATIVGFLWFFWLLLFVAYLIYIGLFKKRPQQEQEKHFVIKLW